jgi:hypothetical protein
MMRDSIMRPWRTIVAKASILLLICLLAGCSMLRLGYANGENLLYWRLSEYIDFNDKQISRVRADLENFFAWHRKTQLQKYAHSLTQVRQQLQRETTASHVLVELAALKKHLFSMIDYVLPRMADMALSLESFQIDYLEQKFTDANEKYRKENLSGTIEDRQRSRYRKVLKQAEYWFGDFSAEQRAHIRAASDARPLDNALLLEERTRRQREFIALLRTIRNERPSREEAMSMLLSYAMRVFEGGTHTENGAFFDASRQSMAEMIAVIVNVATPEQKAHAEQRLQSVANDCLALAASGT